MKLIYFILLTISLCAKGNIAAQAVELGGKKYVIEGTRRGWNALLRDSVVLVHRTIPRRHDYLEFFDDSTFHFNYLNYTDRTNQTHYQKSLWSPGVWEYHPDSNSLKLVFTDNQRILSYSIRNKPNNTLILYTRKQEKN